MLSILIPCYNYDASSLLFRLDELLQQVNFEVEIIFNDDCSTHKTFQELNQKAALKIKATYIENKENLGRTSTRQNLAKQAKFDILLFLDADVIPVRESYLKKLDIFNFNSDLVFGGIEYAAVSRTADTSLRWKYGKVRESISLQDRKSNPYSSILSPGILIRKDKFFEANSFLDRRYGVDVLFSYNLKKLNFNIRHIDNPVYHLGLEPNHVFITKTKQALDTLWELEKNGILPDDFKKIQKAYKKLSKFGLLRLFMFVMDITDQLILTNLKGANPSLFLFDLYRLNYYAFLRK